jgi:DNA/RNA-binding domain of Phe-tRNA-synthetase-like protein
MNKINWAIPIEKKKHLSLFIGQFSELKVEKNLSKLSEIEMNFFNRIKNNYSVETLKDDPKVRSYRDFYWKWKIADPTKVRPASESLIRRILINNNIWKINTFVNAYNLASALTGISLGAYDEIRITYPLTVRFSKEDEVFVGIGSSKPKILSGNELVIADQEGIISLYPHRDAERTKITLETSKALLIAFGVSGISEKDLRDAIEVTAEILKKIGGGKLVNIQSY